MSFKVSYINSNALRFLSRPFSSKNIQGKVKVRVSLQTCIISSLYWVIDINYVVLLLAVPHSRGGRARRRQVRAAPHPLPTRGQASARRDWSRSRWVILYYNICNLTFNWLVIPQDRLTSFRSMSSNLLVERLPSALASFTKSIQTPTTMDCNAF